jgi:transcription elongation factor Elf1
MSTLTKKQKKAYLKEVNRIGRKCPFCGSYKVSGGHAELGEMWVRQDVECNNCGEDCQDVYKLVDIEKENSDED